MVSRNKTRLTLLALAAFAVLSACEKETSQSPAASVSPVTIRVMTFNIEWGGANVDFSKVVEAIQVSNADIVGIQEAEGNLQRLATELGWHYNLRNYAVSRFPLIEPPDANGKYVLVEIEPGKVVALANVHLPSAPYGPDAVRDGATLDEIIQLERAVRLPKIEPKLDELGRMAARGMPVFLTGDFNAPAHTDWSEDMVGARRFMPFAIEWPVSVAVAAAGFRDSWRTVYTDPKTHPGLTWWAGRPPIPNYVPGENDAEDRIDFIWYAGPAEVLTSEIVGEKGRTDVSYSVSPWPSDHRGVVSQFSVTPAEIPALVSTEHRIYELGDDVGIVFSKVAGASIEVLRMDGDREISLFVENPVNDSGQIRIPGDKISAGQFAVRTLDASGVTMEKEFWVLDPSLSPTVDVIGDTFTVGQSIPINWQDAPGNKNDYVAVFHAENPANNEDALAWTYIDAAPHGHLELGKNNAEWGWPLAPGKYVVRLLKDDGYDSLAESAVFQIN